MTEERWQALVRRYEARARDDPKAYKRRVALFASFGFAAIALALLVLLALAGVVVWLAITHPGPLIKLLIPILALAWVVVSALAVRLEPPDGLPLRGEDAPELFQMVDEVNRTVQGPKVHHVLLDGSMNAMVVQQPRLLGLLGSTNYVVLGLPYMQALAPDEYRAVIAHELGHLSRSHGRFGTWLYRVRAAWLQLLEKLEQEKRLTTGLFRRFAAWYVPRLDAQTFPLMRTQEFEADEAAAKAAGAEAAATGLLRGSVGARWLEQEYWPKLYRRASDEAEPPRHAYLPLRSELPKAKAHQDARKWLEDELARPADPDDTHPSLAERLEHLGVSPETALAAATNGAGPPPTAAETFLGAAEESLTARIDDAWRSAVAPDWNEEHQRAEEARAELTRLDERAAREELPIEDAAARAQLTEEFRGGDEALPLYRELVSRDASFAPAHFAIGQILLDRGDEDGLRHLDDAMEHDPTALIPACEAAFVYLKDRERDAEAERYRERAEKHSEVIDAAEEERAEVEVDDDLKPHDLDDELVERVRAQIARHEEVKEAFLVRKEVRHFEQEFPLYVVALIPKHKWRTLWRDASAEEDDKPTFVDAVARDIELPFDFHVIVPGPRSGMDKRLEQIPRAKIFSR